MSMALENRPVVLQLFYLVLVWYALMTLLNWLAQRFP
jgi:hypothetical protein